MEENGRSFFFFFFFRDELLKLIIRLSSNSRANNTCLSRATSIYIYTYLTMRTPYGNGHLETYDPRLQFIELIGAHAPPPGIEARQRPMLARIIIGRHVIPIRLRRRESRHGIIDIGLFILYDCHHGRQ